MKKIFLFLLVYFLTVFSFSLNVSADTISSNYFGFSVDSQQYGNCVDYYFREFSTEATVVGVDVVIGFNVLRTAVYEDQYDDDWALVIIQTQAEPRDVTVKPALVSFNFDSGTREHNLHSDIDGSSISFGYGAYITAYNYEMEQPSPMATPTTTTYTASIEIGPEVKASGSVTFVDNELDFDYNHSTLDEIYDVSFLYSPAGSNNTYMNSLTYNKGAFLVDMSVSNSSNAGKFVNKTVLTATYSTSNFWYGTFWGEEDSSSYIYY